MNKPTPSSPLAHLTHNELQELITLYYEGDCTVADLLKRFAIQAPVGKLVSYFPHQEEPKALCPYCGVPMYRNWTSRSSREEGRLSSDCRCHTCGHTSYSKTTWRELCQCANCVREKQRRKQQQEAQEREAIHAVYGKERRFTFTGTPADIDLKSAIYLLCLERQSVSGEIGIFSPPDEAESPCSPDTELTCTMLTHLLHATYIRVDPASSRKAFSFDDKRIPFYPVLAQYYANVGQSPEEAKATLRALALAFKSKTWFDSWRITWKETIASLWQELALYECLQYLEYLGSARGFDIPRGDKTRATLCDALNDYPTSVVYQFIWSAVVKASDYYQSTSVSRKQAANSIIGNIHRFAEKVRLGVWQARPYGRHKSFRPSALYETLFNLVLHIGDAGFTTPYAECLPALRWIDEQPEE